MRRFLLLSLVLTLTACQITLVPLSSLTGTWEGTSDELRVVLSMSETPASAMSMHAGSALNGSGRITSIITGEYVAFRVTGDYSNVGVSMNLEVIDDSGSSRKYYGHFQGDVSFPGTLVGRIDIPAGTVGPFASRAPSTSMTLTRR